jgi:1-acyl-sn-glycerol-3-phosphate acyltransferase
MLAGPGEERLMTPSPLPEVSHRAVLDRRVLEIVEQVVGELGGPASRRRVSLDDSLDRDLGIGSLERVEVLVRLEQAFGTRLSDAVMSEAETPRDLADAIGAATPALPEFGPPSAAPVEPATGTPQAARTLIEALRWHADADAERVHVFLRHEDGTETPITYGSLWTEAARIGAGLRERGIGSGASVALMLRTEAAFFTTFYGTLLAGAVPVPIYPPFRPDRLEEYAERQLGILRNADARLLVTFGQAEPVARLLRGRVPSLAGVTTSESLSRSAATLPLPDRRGADAALIQYTSGSTGAPKGVLLTHANMLANIRAIGEAIAIRPDDVGVSWLPLYHDMGLIGSWLASLYFGIPIVILSPLAFLARPARWLWAIHAHRATVSPAPNFAFDLCVRRASDADLAGLDLGSWRCAFNGSEPVSPDTIERFTHRFAAYGFKSQAMCPVYGLAESSVALTVPPMGRDPWVDRVVRDAFQAAREARAAPASDPNPLRFVSCGRPLPGHEVRVVDAAGRPVGDRVEGRVEFRGPSVTSGYFRNPEATQAVMRAGWMDSGDLGYQADGELFITGRRKDMIIKAGRNLYPQEIEEVVGDVPGVRKGCVAAFGVPDLAAGTERLVVLAESRETRAERLEGLRATAIDRLVSAIGVPPDEIVIARPGAVLKTSSGKIRRGATRDAYLRGDVARRRRSAWTQWVRLGLRDVPGRLSRVRDRAARLAYAAYVAVLVGCTIPVLWILVWAAPPGRPADRLVRAWCRGMLRLGGCPVQVEGVEHLHATRPAVLAANHSSYVDSVVLFAALPVEFRFVAKRELLSTPVVGAVIRKVGHLTVERFDPAESALDAARIVPVLHGGMSLLFFPEGTFVRAPGLLPFRLGAFKAAVEASCPVIPIGLRGTRAILPADSWLPWPGRVAVSIGSPIPPEGVGWPEMVRLRDRARDAIARLTGEPLLGPAPPIPGSSRGARG